MLSKNRIREKEMRQPKIGIIMGSESDSGLVRKALASLSDFDLPCTMRIASAHRTPAAVTRWIYEAEKAGVEVFIAVAGMAAALPGMVASQTLLPVIGVPIDASYLRGQDALYSIVQMPPGIPVATVGINNVKNALLLAAHILALKYPEYRERLKDFRRAQAKKVELAQRELASEFPQFVLTTPKKKPLPPKVEQPPFGKSQLHISMHHTKKPQPVTVKPNPPEAKTPVEKSGHGFVCELDAQNPEAVTIEVAADIILDGGIVAIPTDTVYGLACDSTNPKAVERLYAIKGRERSKAIPVLIDGMRTLARLVRDIPPDVESMLKELWPGALTVVFPKPETMLSAVSQVATLGIRMPDSTIALSLISVVARPLAVTSANPSGMPPATTAPKVREYFGNKIDMILDGGETKGEVTSTVLSVLEEPYKILREGVLSFETLKAYLKNLRHL